MDDLVERLRDTGLHSAAVAAARIEELEIGLRNAQGDVVAACSRITALEASLAEAEGRVIAEVVAWLRKEAEWYDETDDGWSGFDRIAQGHREAATALETGEWKKDSPPPPTVV